VKQNNWKTIIGQKFCSSQKFCLTPIAFPAGYINRHSHHALFQVFRSADSVHFGWLCNFSNCWLTPVCSSWAGTATMHVSKHSNHTTFFCTFFNCRLPFLWVTSAVTARRQCWTWFNLRIAIQADSATQNWIGLAFEKINRIRYGYPNCIGHCSIMLISEFSFGYKPDWIKYLDRSTGLGSDRITQWKFRLV